MTIALKKRKVVNLKAFRENTEVYIQAAKLGQSFVVYRRSEPVFTINPVDEEAGWETLIDFNAIKKGGVPATAILDKLKDVG